MRPDLFKRDPKIGGVLLEVNLSAEPIVAYGQGVLH